MRHHESGVTERVQILLSIGLGSCADFFPRIAGFQGVTLPSWIQARALLISNCIDCRILSTGGRVALPFPCVRWSCFEATVRCGSWLGWGVHTPRWAVQRPRDDYTLGATMVPRRALGCSSPSGAVRAAVVVVGIYRLEPWLARVKQACTVCWGAKLPVMVRCGARPTSRHPGSRADTIPPLQRARNAESARSPGDKAETV